jgi:hypothetical protein
MRNIYLLLLLLLPIKELPAQSLEGAAHASASPSSTISPTPLASHSPTKKANKPRQIELLELRLLFIEHQLESSKDGGFLPELNATYEELLAYYCMPRITLELNYLGNKKSGECSELISKFKKFSPSNPVATCAESGIDSRECRLAYKNVEAASNAALFGQMSKLTRELAEIEARVSQDKNALLIEQLEKKIRSLTSNITPKSSLSEKKILLANYSQLLALVCKPVRSAETKINQSSVEKKDPLLAAAPSVIATQILKTMHLRFLPPRCLQHLERSLKISPAFPSALCHRFGYTSPQCIDAKRKEEEEGEKKSPLDKKKDEDIGRF